MRKVILGLLILLLCAAQSWAKISVSPVIIKAEDVKKGDFFTFQCASGADHAVEIKLSLALFDQDSEGSVIFLEDEGSLQKVNSLLTLSSSGLRLAPYGEEIIEVRVLKEFPASLSAVLFVKTVQLGIPTRLAALLLFSSEGTKDRVVMTSWQRSRESVAVTVENKGDKAGLWQGALLLYNSLGTLAERMDLKSGLVLAGRSRDFKISLPAWASQIELEPEHAGLDL